MGKIDRESKQKSIIVFFKKVWIIFLKSFVTTLSKLIVVMTKDSDDDAINWNYQTICYQYLLEKKILLRLHEHE